LTTFCEQFAGLSPFSVAPWSGRVIRTPLGPAPEGFETLKALVETALKGLPRLSVDTPSVERLRNNLWMIDIGLRNDGILPTLCARERAVGFSAGVSLKVAGGKLVGAGVRRGDAQSYEALRAQEGSASIGPLEGRESVRARILVEAGESASIDVSLESPRAGQKIVKIPLQ
jgi:hypothetical protein